MQPPGGQPDLFDILTLGCGEVRALGEEFGVPIDCCQQVVEVVGDSTRELANGFHSLRLA